VYVEPYPKSKAFEFHDDAISPQDQPDSDIVAFVPFVGVGPRKFFDLFSMRLSAGFEIERENTDGRVFDWKSERSHVRMQMLPCSYLEKETKATERFDECRKDLESRNGRSADHEWR
jgi:hypothetical protein